MVLGAAYLNPLCLAPSPPPTVGCVASVSGRLFLFHVPGAFVSDGLWRTIAGAKETVCALEDCVWSWLRL